MALYVSEATRFLQQLKEKRPSLEAEQQHGAAVIDVLAFDVVLHHRFVEADLDALAVKGVVEAENGRGKADAGAGGNDEDCFCHVVLLRR